MASGSYICYTSGVLQSEASGRQSACVTTVVSQDPLFRLHFDETAKRIWQIWFGRDEEVLGNSILRVKRVVGVS